MSKLMNGVELKFGKICLLGKHLIVLCFYEFWVLICQ